MSHDVAHCPAAAKTRRIPVRSREVAKAGDETEPFVTKPLASGCHPRRVAAFIRLGVFAFVACGSLVQPTVVVVRQLEQASAGEVLVVQADDLVG